MNHIVYFMQKVQRNITPFSSQLHIIYIKLSEKYLESRLNAY